MESNENETPGVEVVSTEEIKTLNIRETSEARLANDEFLQRMMSFSPYGALVQAFVLEAIRNYSQAISDAGATPPPEYRSFIAWENWHGVGVDVLRQLNARFESNFPDVTLLDLPDVTKD
jgi:hypothetical protein